MQLTAYELALIAGGFTVLGTLVGAIVTYRLALQLAENGARRDAGRRLREAFAPELSALDPARTVADLDIKKLLLDAWPRHHAAVDELAVHLGEAEKKQLFDAWTAYCQVGGSVRFYDYLSGDDQAKSTFQDRVKAILKHTKD